MSTSIRQRLHASRAAVPDATIDLADALTRSWPPARYDLVIGNPPFLSQMAEATTRGGASTRGGGPYADVAVEFLALGAELVDPDGGRLAFVLPQSLLASRDAAAIRARIDERASLVWSWWSADRVFDAQVHTCVVAFEFGTAGTGSSAWSQVVTRRRGVPDLPGADTRRASRRPGPTQRQLPRRVLRAGPRGRRPP